VVNRLDGTGLSRIAISALALFILLVWRPAGPRAESAGKRLTVAAVTSTNVRQWDATLTRMSRTGELRSRQLRDDTLLGGRTHERFDQYYRGVRVF
jgi:hypothetical protein